MDLKMSEFPPVSAIDDVDTFPIVKFPVAPGSNRSSSWALVKSLLKVYFDPIYASAAADLAWKLNGSTVGVEKFIGTLDNFEFPVRVNNIEIARFKPTGIKLTVIPGNDDALTDLLAIDGSGEIKYRKASTIQGAPAWLLDGTTVGAEKWLGTKDNFPVPIRVNNIEIVRATPTGAVYFANYSDSYTDRHLIDKQYVDNIGAVSFARFRANTGSTAAADPGIGNLRWNRSVQNASFELYIDSLTDGFGISVDGYFALITPDSILYIQKQNDAAQYQRWRVLSAANMTGWWKFGVELINDGGGNIVNSAPILLGINLSPSSYSGNMWNWNGSTVGSEKWIGTKDNFEFPIRVNSIEVARFKASGAALLGAPTATTPPLNDVSTRIATTAFVQGQVQAPVDLGTIAGAVSIDLSTGNVFSFVMSGNITSFTFTNEMLGRFYTFIVSRATNSTITLTAGKYRLPFGAALSLTNPTLNGIGTAVDVITCQCNVLGRLDVVVTYDLQNN